MTQLVAGTMYRPSDVTANITDSTLYVVEQFNHRVSKWNYTAGSFTFTIDAGQVTSITVNDGGTLYSDNDEVLIGPPTLNIANPVNATAQVGAEAGGIIQVVTVLNGGNGYDPNNLPTVTAETAGTPADLTAVVSTPWGNNGDGTTGQPGPILNTTDNNLNHPTGISYESTNDKLYLTDTFHNRLRVINPDTGVFETSAGTGGTGVTNFYHPAGIAINNAHTKILIADELNNRAVKYDVNSGDPNNPLVSGAPTPLGFIRPHGVAFDIDDVSFKVTDTVRGLISEYNTDGITFNTQFGTPGTTGTDLFFPSSGHGTLTGTTTQTTFADTRNNILKTLAVTTIANTTGTIPGTGDGQLYYPESVSSFSDGANYVIAANTLNNRVEAYSNVGTALTFQSNFGSP